MYSPKFRTHAALAAFAAACPAWRRRRTPFFESLEPRTLLSGNVVINEIHYNPNIDYEAVEFLELTNAGDAPFDLSGARFTNGIDYTFPAGTSLAPGAYVVIAQNPAAVLDKWGLAALGPWTGKLSNEGEKVTLKDAGGTTLDEVNYGINFPWPVTGDYGDSIELINPAFDNSLPGNWRASTLNPAATLLNANATWRYRKGVNEPPSTWKNPGFDEGTDSQPWQNGVTSIGYGDGDDLTNISDMVSSYSSIYLRNTFTITGTVPTSITLRLFVDDGAIVYINGIEVTRAHVSAGNKTYTSLATDHEAAWETFTLSNPSTYLNLGINTIAIHAMNSTLDSSDFSIDCQLIIPAGGISGATPGAKNSDFAVSTPPLLDKLTQSVQQPVAGQDMTITIKASDPSGIQSVVLQYQTVDPGSYIRYTDAAYKTSWISLAMHDDGLNGDAAAWDGIYSVTIPASVQTNRRLVRYRIIATDTTNASLQVPYTSDTQPNFAYYVYNGVPAWTGANQPGVTAPVTFGTDITNSLPVYQLIANNTDVTNSQYVSNYNDMPFYATMVYDGVVYDDIIFTNRGEFSTYVSGKNKWAIKFNTGHLFAARDNYGNLYSEKWRRIDLNTNAEPWLMVNRGMAGLDESVSHRLFQLAGIASPNTNYVQFRVVDAAAEAPAGDQYGGDMWGLYLAVEHTGSHWLDEHNLADGNVYEIVNSVGDSRTLSPDQVSDGSDWNNLLANIKVTSTPLSYWQDNINLEEFYSFNAISRVTSNVDLRPTYNHVMYHAPDGHWQIIPWDLDMMMVPETHQLGQTYLNNMFVYPTLKTDYANRARELLDLLFTDKSRTGGQVAQVVDEFARFIDKSDGAGNYLNGWAELDQYMWNYNPRTTSDHKGTFYKTPMNDTRFGGTWTRTLATADFEGMVNYLINFMTDTDPNSWAIGDGDQRGYGFNYLESEAADAAIPFTPTVAYSGTSGFPSDKLKFTASAYSDPNGSPFASMEWRIGEISSPGTPGFNAAAPWKYEINSVWESGELAAFNAQVSIPAGILQTGHTYRLRVRYKDDTGRWSHWSDVSTGTTQFLATAPVGIIQTSLRITELNYNPAANGGSLPGNAADINDYEFIELKNFGSQSINLQNVQFSTGVTLTFGDVSLNPGESGVVVRNLANFQARYGTSIKVLGVYAGSLDNGGERIVLLNSDGSTLKDFTYDDTGTGWYPTTDGGGPTLVVRNPASNPDLSAAANWRASFQVGGTPGSDETTPRVMGVTLLGSSWQTAGYAIPTGAAQSAILPWSGIDAIKITFDQNVTVQQANLIVQSSVLLTPTLAISGFSYDAATFTALWSLASAVGADRIRLNLADTVHGIDNFNLDGDWNSKLNFPSGDGISGGAFVFDLNVLPGDVDRNGVVQAADGLAVRNLLGAAAGDGSYSAFADTNHNGVIQASDGLLVRGQLGSSLPDASFAAVSFAATPAAALVAIPTGLVASPLGRIGLLNSLPTIVSTSGVPKTTATIVALKIPIPTARPNVGKIAPRGGELPRISNPWVHLQTVPPQSFMALQPDFHFVVDISTHPALITKES